MKINILTEASNSIGMGHLMRCIAFYTAFRDQGWDTVFILEVFDYTQSVAADLHHYDIDWLKNVDSIKSVINSEDIVFIDTISITQEILSIIKTITKKVIIIDDWLRLYHTDSLVIDWTVNVENTKKHQHNIDGNTLLLGHKYSVLRAAFINQKKHQTKNYIDSILITMGGSDVRQLTIPIVEHLIKSFPEIKFDVVIGSGFLIQEYQKYKHVNFHYDVNDKQMASLMQNNDICISAAGQTLYELVAVGIPTIAVKIIDNQEGNIKGFMALDLLVSAVEWNDPYFFEKIDMYLRKILCNFTYIDKYLHKVQSLNFGMGMPLILKEINIKFGL